MKLNYKYNTSAKNAVAIADNGVVKDPLEVVSVKSVFPRNGVGAEVVSKAGSAGKEEVGSDVELRNSFVGISVGPSVGLMVGALVASSGS